MPASPVLAADAARLLAKLRAERPLVQAITNYVSMDVAANALLAIGASPAMVHAPEELEDFLGIANALAVNIGTLSRDWVESMLMAAEIAGRLGKPWVLDPVGVGATRFRDETTGRLLALKPTIVRGNASEIMASAGAAGLHHDTVVPKGVDSAHGTDVARGLRRRSRASSELRRRRDRRGRPRHGRRADRRDHERLAAHVQGHGARLRALGDCRGLRRRHARSASRDRRRDRRLWRGGRDGRGEVGGALAAFAWPFSTRSTR